MNEKTESKNYKFDSIKWVIAWLLFFVAVGLNFYFAKVMWLVRLAGWTVLVAFLGVMLFNTRLVQKSWIFAKEARIELYKVIWPTRDETIKVTLIVVALVILVSLVLWAMDSALLWAMGWLTSQRG